MNLEEALAVAEIVLGTTEIGSLREGNQLAAAAPRTGMTIALALMVLIMDSPPVKMIAGEAGVAPPQADQYRALSSLGESRTPTQSPEQVSPMSTL